MNLSQLEMKNWQLEKNNKKYYVIYARKSLEDEDRQIASIPDQLNILNDIIISNSLLIVDEPFTESKSAKMPGRTQFNRMLEEIYSRDDIKGIICWKLNRLFRNPKEEGEIRQLLSDGTIEEIITPSKTYQEVDSDFMMAIEGAQAQRFIRDLREDTVRGMKHKLDNGHAPVLAPPGYRNAVEMRQGEKEIHPHKTQFHLVRKLFELFMTGNYSVEGLLLEARKLKVKSNRGNPISRTQLHKMLSNPFYTGTRYVYGGKLYTNGAHKRMLDDEEFDLIQSILARRSHPRGIVRNDLLTGLLRCGQCKMAITSEVKHKTYKSGKTQEFVYYRCTKKRFNDGVCPQPYINGKDLEKQVLDYLQTIQLSSRFVEWVKKYLQLLNQEEVEVRNAKLKTLEQSYNLVLKKLDKVTNLVLEDMLTIEQGKAKKSELLIEKQKLLDQLNNLDKHVNEWNTLTLQTFDFVRSITDRFSNGSPDQRKTILRVIGSDLILKDKTLSIELREPFEYVRKAKLKMEKKAKVRTQELPVLSSQEAFLGSKNTVLGDVPDLNRRPSVPQTDTLTS